MGGIRKERKAFPFLLLNHGVEEEVGTCACLCTCAVSLCSTGTAQPPPQHLPGRAAAPAAGDPVPGSSLSSPPDNNRNAFFKITGISQPKIMPPFSFIATNDPGLTLCFSGTLEQDEEQGTGWVLPRSHVLGMSRCTVVQMAAPFPEL